MKAFRKIQSQLSVQKPAIDINSKLRALDEKKVQVTFTDIWDDYMNYRKAYFFH